MTRRILARSCAAVLLALLLGAIQMESSLASPAHSSGSSSTFLAVDSDGDGIPDDLDPDDDNDGIPDSDQGGQGVSSGNGPLPDSDSDGITDDMDPDDNNNAVTDENEPALSTSGSNASNPGSPSSTNPDSSGTQPLVMALPVTGAGESRTSVAAHLAVIMAFSACAVAVASSRRFVSRHAPAARRVNPFR